MKGERSMKNKKISKFFRSGLLFGFLCGSVAGILSGCGGEHGTAGHGNTESISGTAVNVSGQAVDTAEAKEHQYCTDTNLYMDEAFDADNSQGYWLIQTRLDGTHKKNLKLEGFSNLIRVTGGYLYYVTTDDTEKGDDVETSGICRVPVEKDDDGWDVVRSDKVEELVTSEGRLEVYSPDSHYIYYMADIGNERLTRYDLESGETVLMDQYPGYPDAAEAIVLSGRSQIFVLTYGGLFLPDDDGTGWIQVSDSEDIFWNLVDWEENAFFYVAGHNNPGKKIKKSEAVWKIDLASGEEKEFIKREELGREAVKALDISQEQLDGCWITKLFCEGDRLFVQMQLNIVMKNDYCIDYYIFSQGIEETELRYERELTECMQNHGVFNEEGKFRGLDQSVVWNDAQCYAIVNGKAFLCLYDYTEYEEHVGYYDLATGAFSWLSEKNAVYYEPLYDGQIVFWTDYTERYLEAAKVFTGIGWLPGDEEDYDDDEYVQKKMY